MPFQLLLFDLLKTALASLYCESERVNLLFIVAFRWTNPILLRIEYVHETVS